MMVVMDDTPADTLPTIFWWVGVYASVFLIIADMRSRFGLLTFDVTHPIIETALLSLVGAPVFVVVGMVSILLATLGVAVLWLCWQLIVNLPAIITLGKFAWEERNSGGER